MDDQVESRHKADRAPNSANQPMQDNQIAPHRPTRISECCYENCDIGRFRILHAKNNPKFLHANSTRHSSPSSLVTSMSVLSLICHCYDDAAGQYRTIRCIRKGRERRRQQNLRSSPEPRPTTPRLSRRSRSVESWADGIACAFERIDQLRRDGRASTHSVPGRVQFFSQATLWRHVRFRSAYFTMQP